MKQKRGLTSDDQTEIPVFSNEILQLFFQVMLQLIHDVPAKIAMTWALDIKRIFFAIFIYSCFFGCGIFLIANGNFNLLVACI